MNGFSVPVEKNYTVTSATKYCIKFLIIIIMYIGTLVKGTEDIFFSIILVNIIV